MRGLRSLAYGLLAVLLGVALTDEGFSPVAIGILITVSLVGDMVGTYVIGLVADSEPDQKGTQGLGYGFLSRRGQSDCPINGRTALALWDGSAKGHAALAGMGIQDGLHAVNLQALANAA